MLQVLVKDMIYSF